ncbi:MAG: methionyl-tRNA formyltransferase [Calditrichaeota bacterium]|nr:MAG: methionyl-tRNA formyltransferase [Calditrichota bacterium]
MGTPDFAVSSAQALLDAGNEIVAVVTVPDKQAGRGRKIHESAVKIWAKNQNIPIFQPHDLKDEQFCADLKSFEADIFVVVAFRILPRQIFTIPPKGTINLHGSLLPAYRGAAPINWAIINGETETGVTTFLIDGKVDTGETLLKESVTIADDETFGELYNRLKTIGADLLTRTVAKWLSGEIQSFRQTGEATKAPKITPQVCEIEWFKSAENIRNLVRGLAPVPTAFTFYNKKRLKIFSCEAIAIRSEHPPGVVVEANKKTGMLTVATGVGLLKLNEIQLEGKKRMSVDVFLQGFQIKAGDRFGLG